MRTILVGWDARESDFYELCKYTLETHSSEPLNIIPIKHKKVRDLGLFTRSWRIDATGQMYDELDGKPCSTEFSFTRFLVPEMCALLGIKDGTVMFVDCDFLFLQDVNELFREAERTLRDKPVAVVKHNFTPKNATKIDGVAQEPYPKKLWSSLMLFNLLHPDCKALTKEIVNTKPGSYLHQFEWVTGGDANIGSLGERWNFIPQHSEIGVPLYDIGAVHMTHGSPEFTGEDKTPYSELYYQVQNDYRYDKFLDASENIRVFPRR